MVSSPRNQRYLHPRFFGAGEFVCKVVEGSKFDEQLDPEIFIIGNEAYFLDECPDGFGGFDPIAFLPESVQNSLLNIVMVGVGGYVVGRSGEKIADKFKGPN